jgi:predicted ATPase
VGDDVIVSEADKPFVETVRIQNFGCARDVTLELTRLHALIGPNDSGKSTVLAAIRTACQLIDVGETELTRAGRLDPRGIPGSRITIAWGTETIACFREPKQHQWKVDTSPRRAPLSALTVHVHFPPLASGLAGPARGARLVRWDPDAIRRPCELIPESEPLFVGERGDRLAAVYDALLSRDRTAFGKIEADVRNHFPTVKEIWLPALNRSEKTLGVTLHDGTRVSANEMSEGLLYWLAFAVLPHVDPTAILLIEEPENGLHPSRIAEVVKVLREVSKTMQVIIATHSPLVINELQPDEVTILTRDDKTGAQATRMDRTKHFQQRQQVYALGELWLSFADGLDEAALVKDSEAGARRCDVSPADRW